MTVTFLKWFIIDEKFKVSIYKLSCLSQLSNTTILTYCMLNIIRISFQVNVNVMMTQLDLSHTFE